MQVSIISPERSLFEGEATAITLPGVVGSFTVLASHAPLVSELAPGEVVVNQPSGSQVYVVEGGFAEVSHNKVIALVEGAVLPSEIDKAKEQEKLEALVKSIVAGDAALDQREKESQTIRAKLRAAQN